MRLEFIDPGSARASRALFGALAGQTNECRDPAPDSLHSLIEEIAARAPRSAREARALPGRSAQLPDPRTSRRDVPTRRAPLQT